MCFVYFGFKFAIYGIQNVHLLNIFKQTVFSQLQKCYQIEGGNKKNKSITNYQ